jgi:hypothetical protein
MVCMAFPRRVIIPCTILFASVNQISEFKRRKTYGDKKEGAIWKAAMHLTMSLG